VILFGCLAIAAGLGAILTLRDIWQLFIFWGVIVGIGTGAIGNVLGATIAHRWFRTHRGLIIGAFGAATSTGQLLFIPASGRADQQRRLAFGDRPAHRGVPHRADPGRRVHA